MKEKFEKILEDNGIYGENVIDILSAVSEMFEHLADKTIKDYPYATETAEQYEKIAAEIFALTTEL